MYGKVNNKYGLVFCEMLFFITKPVTNYLISFFIWNKKDKVSSFDFLYQQAVFLN